MLYVLHTFSMYELIVVEQLRRKGIEAYCPRKICIERRRGEWIRVERIIFSGYVFIKAEKITPELWHELVSCTGAIRLLSISPLPADEEAYILGLKDCIGISRGYILNGEFHATCGFLKSHDYKIIKCNTRGKRVAAEVTIYGKKEKIILSVEFDPPPRDKLRGSKKY